MSARLKLGGSLAFDCRLNCLDTVKRRSVRADHHEHSRMVHPSIGSATLTEGCHCLDGPRGIEFGVELSDLRRMMAEHDARYVEAEFFSEPGCRVVP
jgi:hypothetical protein